MPKAIGTALRAALLLILPGLVAWATGRHFLFPSLGPTAYTLVRRMKARPTPAAVLGGHFWGVLAGLACYHLFARGLALGTAAPPESWPLFRLSVAGAVSVAATVAAMEGTKTSHSPACATTLIVSLGLLPTLTDGCVILLSVLLMVIIAKLLPDSGGAGSD